MHDPDDEVTVIAAEGIGKGILRGNTIEVVGEMKKIDLTPDREAVANIIRFLRQMYAEGHKAQAHVILQAGWGHLSFVERRQILMGERGLQ